MASWSSFQSRHIDSKSHAYAWRPVEVVVAAAAAVAVGSRNISSGGSSEKKNCNFYEF